MSAPSGSELAALIVDALADAGEALAQGDLMLARELCDDVLAAHPDHPRALVLLGRALIAAGDSDSAEACFARAPDAAEARFALADLYESQLRLGDAVEQLRAGLARAPDDPRRWRALGAASSRLGLRQEAVEAFRRAAALIPGDAAAACDLGAALGETGALVDAEAVLGALVKASPRYARAHANLGSVLAATGRLDAAAEAFRRATELASDAAPAWANLGRCLGQLARADEARAAFATAARLAPDDPQIAFDAGRVLLDARLYDEALGHADRFLGRQPGATALLALRLLALRALGRHLEADELAGTDRFVRRFPLPCPDGFRDVGAFNAALAAHARSHPTLAWAPPRHATQAGLHSGSLLLEPKGPIAALEAGIYRALARFVDDVDAGDRRHPFIAHRPREVYLDLWTVILRGQGHQIPHIHPAAWVSGVYHVELPPLGPAERPAGWLELGSPDRPLPDEVRYPVVSIRPEAGTLVLFPSYLYHHTVPTGEEAERISIAVDVLPVPTRS